MFGRDFTDFTVRGLNLTIYMGILISHREHMLSACVSRAPFYEFVLSRTVAGCFENVLESRKPLPCDTIRQLLRIFCARRKPCTKCHETHNYPECVPKDDFTYMSMIY